MSDDGGSPNEDPLRRFLHADSGPLLFVREVLSSALAVALVGLLLFAVAGVWPPMVAVESESMEPHMHPGDLVFMTEPDRFAPSFAVGDTGVVTAETGATEEFRSFDGYGSVVIYQTPERAARGQSPIIHRAMFHVEEGENWYDEANPAYVNGESCQAIRYCPAPHAGFITKGDNNAKYDQALDFAGPVRSDWIRGIAQVRIPYLGWVRLVFSGTVTPAQVGPVGDAGVVTAATTEGSNTTAAGGQGVRPSLASGSPTPVSAR
ncbi:S26 family signal peptidase [Halorarum halobium]|uniref:S26 family signal peptidase n=1 Tax=Halorarum halobium TaxID=3075121 RepID=UPI0028B12F82|nr:S26 family signal peptidase [Halobaculum sp. XH14]